MKGYELKELYKQRSKTYSFVNEDTDKWDLEGLESVIDNKEYEVNDLGYEESIVEFKLIVATNFDKVMDSIWKNGIPQNKTS